MIAKLPHFIPVLSLLFVLAFGDFAEAGCFREFRVCADCAEKKAQAALENWDLDGYLEAVSDAMDCQVDLYHCVFLGKHHDYPACRV